MSLPVNENDEGAIAQTQGKPTDHKTDNNNESMDEDNKMSQNPTKKKRKKLKKKLKNEKNEQKMKKMKKMHSERQHFVLLCGGAAR